MILFPAAARARETPLAGKVVLITGASSGIGAATAVRLAKEGHHVVLGARRIERLEALAGQIAADGGSAGYKALDVTDAANVQDFVDSAAAEYGRVDVIVNNAGVMLLSRMENLLVKEWTAMVDANIKGLLHGIAAALPHFQRQHTGHFITIASIGAHVVSPTSAVYSGTKFAAWAITEGLRQELNPDIRVTTISPGVIDTELATHITDAEARELMVEYRKSSLRADTVARGISYAISQDAQTDINEIILRPTGQR
jgi:NADP-dependent 3-hydroxy acid dehydrogenase YdfG